MTKDNKIKKLQSLLKRALDELARQEEYLPDEYYEEEDTNIDTVLGKEIKDALLEEE